jgi:hypothetical protein
LHKASEIVRECHPDNQAPSATTDLLLLQVPLQPNQAPSATTDLLLLQVPLQPKPKWQPHRCQTTPPKAMRILDFACLQ